MTPADDSSGQLSTSRRSLQRRRHGLVAGKLPPGFRSITAAVSELRRGLEAAVIVERKEIGITDAASLNTACRWETHALICLKQLRMHYADLSPTERAKLSEGHAAASAQRDRAIERLALPSGDGSDPNYYWPTAGSVSALPAPSSPIQASGSQMDTKD